MGVRAVAPDEVARGFDRDVTVRLLRYLQPYKVDVIKSFGYMLGAVLGNLAGPVMIGRAVDEGIRRNDMGAVSLYVLIFIASLVVGMVSQRGMFNTMAGVGQGIIQTLRDELFTHIQYLPLSFFASYETGRLISRVIGDVNVLREMITFSIVGVARDLLTLVGIVAVMVSINRQLSVVALVVVPVMLFIANIWRVYARKAYVRQRTAVADVNAELAESFNGVRVVQAFAREGFNSNRFQTSINQENLQAGMATAWVAALFFPTIEMIAGVAVGALIWLGGGLVIDDMLTAGTLVTFVLYIEQFFFPIRMLAQRYNTFQATMAAGHKIFTLLDSPIEIKDAEGAISLPQIRGEVVFDHVTFGYDDDVAVLKDANVTVPAGSTVALVGHTGAGKSTIINLLLRFYDVTQGAIRVDGHDIKAVTQHSLRSQMGVVLQQTFL
ncbi:MAG: ABC transporter ATP-binding protein, partial [Anaerolineae bacterium]|nr:ABC transporter ATP-binding protein [Anaerolineae bacterium]